MAILSLGKDTLGFSRSLFVVCWSWALLSWTGSGLVAVASTWGLEVCCSATSARGLVTSCLAIWFLLNSSIETVSCGLIGLCDWVSATGELEVVCLIVSEVATCDGCSVAASIISELFLVATIGSLVNWLGVSIIVCPSVVSPEDSATTASEATGVPLWTSVKLSARG